MHLNPVRAALCEKPGEYGWTSHHEFVAGATAADELPRDRVVQDALRLFSRTMGCTVPESCNAYDAFVSWRLRMDRFVQIGGNTVSASPPSRPLTDGGDRHWLETYGACSTGDGVAGGYGIDLRDLALSVLTKLAPHLELDDLRSGGRTLKLVSVRRRIIEQALDLGYRPVQVARFLHISSSAVSKATRSG